MCNLSTGVYNKGYHEGHDTGYHEGHDTGWYHEGHDTGYHEGYDSGLTEGKIEQAKSMAYRLMDFGVPAEKIAIAAGVDQDTLREWLMDRQTQS